MRCIEMGSQILRQAVEAGLRTGGQAVGDVLQQPTEMTVLFEPLQNSIEFVLRGFDTHSGVVVAEAAGQCAVQQVELEENEFIAHCPQRGFEAPFGHRDRRSLLRTYRQDRRSLRSYFGTWFVWVVRSVSVGVFADGTYGSGWNGVGATSYLGHAGQGVTGLLHGDVRQFGMQLAGATLCAACPR